MKTEMILILAGGIHSAGFAIFHIFFWKLFRWKKDLQKISMVNRAIIQILNMRLIYFFLMVAATCLRFPSELYQTDLGRFFLAGISLFWVGRAFEQLFFIRVPSVAVHILTFLFLAGAILFAMPVVI